MMIIRQIPNLITLGNLCFGLAGLYFAFGGEFITASYCIWIAAVLDFLDGFAARLLNVQSPIGAQLDSLADVITFGVLPAFLCFHMINSLGGENYLAISALIIAPLSAYRLAKFNVDTTQTNSFSGLPTPACAFFVSGIPFIIAGDGILSGLLSNPISIAIIAVLLALLLVLPIRLMAFKFKNTSFKDNWLTYLYIASAITLFVIFSYSAIPLVVVLYILLSVLLYREKPAIN
jgi:CDP-diacylglycerol---serine O-phosphatidyltransferase